MRMRAAAAPLRHFPVNGSNTLSGRQFGVSKWEPSGLPKRTVSMEVPIVAIGALLLIVGGIAAVGWFVRRGLSELHRTRTADVQGSHAASIFVIGCVGVLVTVTALGFAVLSLLGWV